MRGAVLGAAVAASLVVAILGATTLPSVVFAQRATPFPSSGDSGLIAVTAAVGDSRQQLTVIDPVTRVVSVYHIELESGEIKLKSVRNIHWDLQMVEFNGTSPLPREIRAHMEQK